MAIPYELLVGEDFNLGYGSVSVTMPAGGTATGHKVGIHTLLSRSYNVRDFGAVGDGVTDDRAAIQSAITQASTDGGGQVLFPPGTYLVTSALTVPSQVWLVGMGNQSLTILRANGNHFILDLNPAHQVRILGLYFDAKNQQASGGAIDFANAGSNIVVEHCYFGFNLYYGLHIAPTSAGNGIYHFAHLRWNGITTSNTAIRIGDDSHNVSDIDFRDISGTANTQSDMAVWIDIGVAVDSISFQRCTFFKGTVGAQVGNNTSAPVTSVSFHDCIIDTMSSYGINARRVTNLRINHCSIQTNSVGINLSSFVTGAAITGNTIQGNTDDGIAIVSGAVFTRIIGNVISDNNTANTASRAGIDVAAGATRFVITGNQIGNNILLTTGHQKYGILIASGGSDKYIVAHNHLIGNEATDSVSDGGSGVNKVVANNLAG